MATRPANQTQVPWVTGLGKVRRSQTLATYAIGSIIDLESGSFMPLGLSDWESQTKLARKSGMELYEPRLQALLGVQKFMQAPIVMDHPSDRTLVDARYSVPAVRFPLWHECPKCHRLGTENNPFSLSSDGRSLECLAHGSTRPKVNTVRFVVACSRGHIDDFPWEYWAHRGKPRGSCTTPVLYLESRGESASLGDLVVSCKSCNSRQTLQSAFSKEGLKGYECTGKQPWLIRTQKGCNVTPRTLQRGASNVHFPVTASALSIPPVSDAVSQLLDEHWSILGSLSGVALETILDTVAKNNDIPLPIVRQAYELRREIETGHESKTEVATRVEEYHALGSSTEDDAGAGEFFSQFLNHVYPAPSVLDRWFDIISAVSRLREVRALAGFTRIQPLSLPAEEILGAVADGRVAPLSAFKHKANWLPAAEIRGEGIFLRFRTDVIDEWISGTPEIVERAAQLDEMHRNIAEERGMTVSYVITPRLLLVHSFAHAMIRQLAIDCGYSSSSLKERLYISDGAGDQTAMNGVLIYTGTPDSEGSLGGLVRLAQPGLIENVVMHAISAAQWCPNDPVCSESMPQSSGELLSGASCHSCLLVPETACEKFNRELDRSALVGSPDGSWKGFFHGIGEDE